MAPEKRPGHAVLLVEDDPNDRLIIQTAFDRSAPGVRLEMARDGQYAMEYLSGQGAYADRSLHPMPHVVLLDLKLPRKSGLEVLEWMRTVPALSGIPVFVLSSSQERADIERAYALGANSYLVKQVDFSVIREFARGIGEYAALIALGPAPDGD